MSMRTPESLISVKPIGANVVLAMRFNESLLNIQNSKLNESGQANHQVVAVGNEVREEIKVGDYVLLHSAPQVRVTVPENRVSVYDLMRLATRVKRPDWGDLMAISPRIDCIEYFAVPDSYVIATTSNEYKPVGRNEDLLNFIDACELGPALELPLNVKKSNIIN